ncbi:MAG: hypothetical protein IPI44_11595 [Sulfuritalea sp.]|nr:hypothetical protein [Sulfuritalea sp.]
MANSYNAPVLAGNADIDEVFAYTKGKHLGSGQEQFAALWRRLRLVMSLRRQRIDDVILPGGAQASATRFAGWVAPGRVIAAPLNGSTTEGRTSHEVERCFSLLAGYGIAGTPPPCHVVADPVLVQSIVVRLPSTLAGRRLVALQLSARKPKQRWPVELFAALAKTLHAESDCGFLVFGRRCSRRPMHPGDDAKAAELVE